MKKIYIIIIALSLMLSSRAQKGIQKLVVVSGVAEDIATHEPLIGATARLTGLNKPAYNYATTADSTGHFVMSNVLPGAYKLTVEFIGYTTYYSSSFIIDASKAEWTLEPVYLKEDGKTLKAVVVKATKPLVENKIDRIVYNVEKDVTSQGGVATDVLRKVPQVSVDVNGNVELLGNPSVRFLINGKPSVIFGNSVADALQSIPASQIQSIEVISSPGAKYDAAGTGGVINIILKKNKTRGFSGIINATAGTRQENASVNLSFKKDNIAVSGYFSGNALLKSRTLSGLTRNAVDTASENKFYLKQNGFSELTRHGMRTGLGIDWDISSKDNLSFSFQYNAFGNANNGMVNQLNTTVDKTGNLVYDELSIRDANTKFSVQEMELSADYRKKFKREREELSASVQLSTDDNHTSYLQSQRYVANDSTFSGSSSNNPGRDHVAEIMVDYAFPVSKDILLETGVKTETESLVSNANVYTFNPADYRYALDDKQSYKSDFQREVYAAYVSGTFQLLKWLDVIAGVRWEHTVNRSNYSKALGITIPDYNNLCPSITVSHLFNEGQTLKFSYAYRLERPEYRDLNPFVNLADPHNISMGNPYIKPEIGNDFQLGYNYNFGNENNLNIVLLYNYNSPDIKSYTIFYPAYMVGDSLYNNVNVTTRSNIASEHKFGLNLSGAFSIASKLTIRPGVQLYQRTTNNIYATPQRISGFEYRATFNINYQFSHGLVAEAFGTYRSGIKWQGRQASFSTYSIAVRKQFLNGKASLGMVAVNAFNKYLTQKTTQEGTGFTATTDLRIPYRSFGISFMYKFGTVKTKQKEDNDLLTKPPVEN